MKWLLRFLWRQVKYCLWIGGFFAGGYVALEYFHQFWVGSIMATIAVVIAAGWVMSFFNSETWTSDQPRRPRESYIETQQRETQEDMDRQQQRDEER